MSEADCVCGHPPRDHRRIDWVHPDDHEMRFMRTYCGAITGFDRRTSCRCRCVPYTPQSEPSHANAAPAEEES